MPSIITSVLAKHKLTDIRSEICFEHRADGTPYTLPPLLEPQPDHEWRVTRHWGSDGEDYHFHYDLAKGETRVVDSLGREDRY